VRTVANSRREFLTSSCAALLGSVAAAGEQTPPAGSPAGAAAPAGSPPALDTTPAVGPVVDAATFAAAEKLVQVELTSAAREQAAQNWRNGMAALFERRTGPRKVALDPQLAPCSRWNPLLPGQPRHAARNRFVRSARDPGPVPAADAAIALAPLWKLSRWMEARRISSAQLTRLYLERLQAFDPRLRCVITLTSDLALAQAERADREIAAGRYRGPLHGIPWGGKDLLDTIPGETG